MTYKSYTDLDVWKKSRELVSVVYSLSKKFPSDEIYGLVSQVKRAAISIPSNIAEGCGRSTTKDSLHFFYIARGSLYELEAQFYLAFDLAYILEAELHRCLDLITNLKKLLNGFINYVSKLT